VGILGWELCTSESAHNCALQKFLKERCIEGKMTSAALRENFFKVAERVESLSGIIDPSNPASLIYAQKVCT